MARALAGRLKQNQSYMGRRVELDAQLQSRPKQELLLALIRRRTNRPDKSELQSLLNQVGWPEFLGFVSTDLYPYLHFRLDQLGLSPPASPEREALAKSRRNTAVHNLRLRHELGRIVQALQQQSIPMMALKGIVLAHTSYHDPSLRPMSDLDLLVPPGRMAEANAILRDLGYEFPVRALPLVRNVPRPLMHGQEAAPVLHLRGSTALVEIHSQLECGEPVLPVPAEYFWSRAITVDLDGLPVRTLCQEDFLFHLCLHLSRTHRFDKGLLPLVDLMLWIDSFPSWDWAGIASRALQRGCATWMYLTLQVARDLVGASVPDSFLVDFPQHQDLPRVRRLVEEQIWSARAGASRGAMFLPRLLAEDSWKRRANLICARMQLLSRRDLGPNLGFASLIKAVQIVSRRVFMLFKRYSSAWHRGQFKKPAIQENVRLARSSDTMFRLVTEQERRARANVREQSAPLAAAADPSPGKAV